MRFTFASPRLATVGLAGPCLLFLVLPLLSRYALGWSHPYGYLSDLAIGSLMVVLVHRRSWWLAVPALTIWSVIIVSNTELINAVGRMPEPGDFKYLTDVQFLSRSTQGAGLSHPVLLWSLVLGFVLYLALDWRLRDKSRSLAAGYLLVPMCLLVAHHTLQHFSPSDADQWMQFNLPHKLLAEGFNNGSQQLDDWLHPDAPGSTPDISALARLDLDGTPLLAQAGKARNVLIITLEGVSGAYIKASRDAIGSSYQQAPMPRLSQWAERGMLTPDYVLPAHQTIRGLYSMLCGDYSKLDAGTPKGVELLANPTRSEQCLPAQLRKNGLSTHFLQGAGLRFMAKDQIMPRMGFEKTLGRDWFQNKAYLEFPWGMDDKSFFEGALTYVSQLEDKRQPWMLTLLTVGTHQPYAAPAAYMARQPDAKLAAIAYLDDAVADFLDALEKQGVLKDTLVVITSDESQGVDKVRLASAWGFNLMLAPEQAQLPALKRGVYGHLDLTASVLDYFAFPIPTNIAGRSMLRDYPAGRAIMSYTNGLLREHDGKGTLTECNFQQVCRQYASTGFIADTARYLGRISGKPARQLNQRAALLNQSLLLHQDERHFQFANQAQIKLKETVQDDWTDNLVGAQYLQFDQNTRTTVSLDIRAIGVGAEGVQLQLKAKEYEQEVALPIPEFPLLTNEQPVVLSFSFDNLAARKAFSFHLIGHGKGAIELADFSVTSRPLEPGSLATAATAAATNTGEVVAKP